MLRSALLIGAGIVAALAFACAPAPPPPAPASLPPPPPRVAACDFVSKVQVLQPNYDPLSRPYSAPENHVQQGYVLRPEIQNDLSDAFSNAPPIVQNSLCGLTGVFINPTGCPSGDVNNCNPFTGHLFSGNSSWGFRGMGLGKGSTYIAISGGLWYLGAHSNAESFPLYENAILQTFAPWSGGPVITSATPSNYPWMTVLAALAHELGHVRRAQVAIPKGFGNKYDFGVLTNCSIGGGNTTDFYIGWNYGSDYKNLRPKNRWRNFQNNSNANNTITDHLNAPFLDNLNINQGIYDLYQPGQPWASLFGGQSPDEDFVETYVLYALLGNKLDNSNYTGIYLQSLPVNIPNYLPVDVPSDLLAGRKQALAQKIQCL